MALEELRAATAADADYGPAHGMYGVVYLRLNEQAKAAESFDRAMRLAPNDPDINHNYGWFLCQTGREQASIQHFMKAVRDPLYPAPWRSYAGGLVTNGCVGEYHSPGTSPFSTGRSSIGHNGLPVARSNT